MYDGPETVIASSATSTFTAERSGPMRTAMPKPYARTSRPGLRSVVGAPRMAQGSRVEIVSAIERRHRESELDASERTAALDGCVELSEKWEAITELEGVHDGAVRLLARHALRAGDAIQLAAAGVAAAGAPSTLLFVTLDVRIRNAAAREGFPVLVP